MNYPSIELFKQLLRSTICASWLHFTFFFMIMSSIKIIFYVNSKKKVRYCKGKKSRKVKFFDSGDVLLVMALTIAAVFLIQDTATILTDLHNDSYVCVYAEYDVSGSPLHLYYGKNSSVDIYTDDGLIHLKRPKTFEGFGQYERENFPEGRCYGTIWYAEHSRIILSFTPDDG